MNPQTPSRIYDWLRVLIAVFSLVTALAYLHGVWTMPGGFAWPAHNVLRRWWLAGRFL